MKKVARIRPMIVWYAIIYRWHEKSNCLPNIYQFIHKTKHVEDLKMTQLTGSQHECWLNNLGNETEADDIYPHNAPLPCCLGNLLLWQLNTFVEP